MSWNRAESSRVEDFIFAGKSFGEAQEQAFRIDIGKVGSETHWERVWKCEANL